MSISCGIPDCTVCKLFAFIPWEEVPTDHRFMELEDIKIIDGDSENLYNDWDTESIIDTLDYIEEIPTYDYDEEI